MMAERVTTHYVLRKKKRTELLNWRLMLLTIIVVLKKMKLCSYLDSTLGNMRQMRQLKRISPNCKHMLTKSISVQGNLWNSNRKTSNANIVASTMK